MKSVVIAAGFALTAAAAGTAYVGPAQSDTGQAMGPCSSREAIARSLAEDYREAPVSLGVMANGNLLQVFASYETGTWTIVSVAPNGISCVLAAGQSWETIIAGLGAPA
ncbi:MAG TPA: hypothetical protein VFG43_05250 [Geminicoccaceae bacterium]|nr:hypothetical protein [Geminicoccaceae bacterium]